MYFTVPPLYQPFSPTVPPDNDIEQVATGQALVLHCCVFVSVIFLPSQVSVVTVLVCTPPPQLLLQALQALSVTFGALQQDVLVVVVEHVAPV